MLIHIIICLITLGIIFLKKTDKIEELDQISSKDFYIIVAMITAVNVLGTALTLTGGSRQLERLRFEKDSSGIVEESLELEVDGKLERFSVDIPGKQISEETAQEEEEDTKSWRELLSEMIKAYNEEKNDPDYYYLPTSWKGQELHWLRPSDSSGMLLAVLGSIGGVMMIVMGIRQKAQQIAKRQEQMLLDYPGIIMKFTLLIEAGLSVRKAFQKIAQDYKRTSSDIRWAYEEIIVTCHEMESGISENDSYYRFGERCGQVNYKMFATLLVQNLHMGSNYLAAMLEQEATNAWEERKRKARIMGEVAATKMLLPMLLNMLVVMFVIMIPAFLSFYGT